MRILISNDDGIEAAGIHSLAEAFSKDHEVTMIAPDSQRSACSHSLSSMYSITFKEEHRFNYRAFSCSGTPADCVKLGVLHLMRNLPDLVLSGINDGRNLGSDVMYSGTVSAAFEGIYLGIPSIAVSSGYKIEKSKLDEISGFVLKNLDRLLKLNVPKTSCLNINYPHKQAVKGTKITPLGIHLYGDGFFPVENGFQLQGSPLPLNSENRDCDIHWYNEGYITITPIQNDRNDYATLNRIKGDF